MSKPDRVTDKTVLAALIESRWLIVAVLLLALALRILWLGSQSLWGDEADSWAATQGGLQEVLNRVQTEGSQGPLYFVLLWAWRHWFGTSEMGLRSLSVVAGTLATLFIWMIVYSVLGRRPALIAALLAAISPLFVYYSQEARPNALAAALAAGAFAFGLRAFNETRLRRLSLLGYVLCAMGAILTHYLAVFAVLATALILPRRRVSIAAWVIATLIAASPALWWVAYGWNRFANVSGMGGPRGLPLTSYLLGVAQTFANGLPSPTGLPAAVMALGLILALAGLVTRRSWPIAGWLALVLIGAEVIGFPADRPGPWIRYVLAALPAFLVLQAAGVERIWQRRATLGAICLGGLLLVSAVSLWHVYTDPALARFDFRGPVQRLAAHVSPADRVFVNVGNPAFFYYYGNTQPGPIILYPGSKNDAVEQMMHQLEEGANGAQRVYLVKYMPPDYDPGGQIESWLGAHGTKTSDEWIEHIRLVSYAFGARVGFDSPAVQHVSDRLGDQIDLIGWALAPDAKAGASGEVTLFWRASGPVTTDYKVFIHVLAANDPERKVAQHDSVPGLGSAPTQQWKAGEIITDVHPLVIPSGEWQLAVGMYDSADGKRLTVNGSSKADDNRVFLGPFTLR